MPEFKIYLSMCHIQAPISCHEVPEATDLFCAFVEPEILD